MSTRMVHKVGVTQKQLRTFGIALSIFLGVISLVQFLKAHIVLSQAVGAGAIVVLLVTIIAPTIIRPIYKGALFIARILGWINTRLFLGLIYYLMFTPIAIIMKLIGRDPLNRKIEKAAQSYWNIRDRTPKVKEHYLRQF